MEQPVEANLTGFMQQLGVCVWPTGKLEGRHTVCTSEVGHVVGEAVATGTSLNTWRSRGNLAKRNLGQPTALAKTRLKRMQYRPGLLDGFFAKIGLDLTPFCNPYR